MRDEIDSVCYQLAANEQMRFYVPEAEGHDDYLMSLALCCRSAQDAMSPAMSGMLRAGSGGVMKVCGVYAAPIHLWCGLGPSIASEWQNGNLGIRRAVGCETANPPAIVEQVAEALGCHRTPYEVE